MRHSEQGAAEKGEYFIPEMDSADRGVFEQAMARQQLFQRPIDSLERMLKLVGEDPPAFLASVSGLAAGEFVVQ
jgi:hypothetical protein